jgi:hypothetical protein
VFTCSGKSIGIAARSLREFVSVLASVPPGVLMDTVNVEISRAGLRWCSVTIRSHHEFTKWSSSIG